MEDPLAELARLIGQEDPFAEFQGEVDSSRDRPASPYAPPPPAPRAPYGAPREPALRQPAPPTQQHPAPRFSPAPGPFSTLAAEVYAEPTHRLAASPGRGEHHALEDAARDLNRSLVRAEAARPAAYDREAARPAVYDRHADDAFETRRQPTYSSPVALPPRVADRDPRADSAAAAVAAALGQSFDLDEAPPPPRPSAREAAPVRMPEPRVERPAPAPAPAARSTPAAPAQAPREEEQFDLDTKAGLDEGVYDYGRSADEHDEYELADSEFDEQYEAYDEEQPARGRRKLMIVAAILGLAVLGTGAVYGYMAMNKSSGSVAGQPPVIRADQGPNKVTPAQPAPTSDQAADGQKLIYDRVGGDAANGKEQVVSREEQPVDVTQAAQPRVILPPSNSAPAPTPSAPAPLGAMPGTAPAPQNPTEPKRVRTLTVRADGSVVESPTTAPAPPPVSYQAPSPAPAANAPAAEPPAPATTGTSAPLSAYTAPAPAPAAPANVPLPPSRVATAASPNAVVPPAAVPSTSTPVVATPATAPASAGGFVVQVASQRSQAEAQTAWKAAQGKFPGILGNYSASFRRADLGDRGIYYRAQVGPFASRDQANELCQSLRAQGGDCVVQKN